jgi:hypothetical protein
MPSVFLNDTTRTEVIPCRPYRGVTLQNVSGATIHVSWTGDDLISNQVTTDPDYVDHSGFEMADGDIIDISDEYKGARTMNQAIYAIGAEGAGSDLELKYFIR